MGDKVDRFGQLLREYRRRALLSQQQLAESSGVSDRTIRNLERGGVAAPRVTTAHMLASALRLEGEQHEEFVEAATAQRAGRNGEEATPGPMHVDAELETLSGGARLALPRPAQLPMAASGFAGRRSELAALDTAWLSARQHDRGAVAAVVGGAGIGKTTLAVEWAHRNKAAFPDGQLFVDMQAFSGGDGGLPMADVLSNCLESLGVPAHRVPASPQMRTSLYRTITADLRLLVLIDNVTSAGDIRALIPSSPAAMTIVTGRQDLEGLTIREGGAPIVVDVMATDDALDLLGERLAGRSPALPVDALRAVAQACGRLPLALAIAGARLAGTRSEDLHAVVHEITHAADLGPFRADDADSDIRTVFSWSYRALPADAQSLFRTLGVHPGADFEEGAAAAAAGWPEARCAQALAELKRANLLRRRPADRRYAIHDLVHRYAFELHRLDPPEVVTGVVDRLYEYYRSTAAGAADSLDIRRRQRTWPGKDGAAQASPMTVPAVEQALSWFTRNEFILAELAREAHARGDAATCWSLTDSLAPYLKRRGAWARQRDIQELGLRASSALGSDQAGYSALSLARALYGLGDHTSAAYVLDEAAQFFKEADDRSGEADVFLTSSDWSLTAGDLQEALDLANTSLSICAEIGDTVGTGRALNGAGWDLIQMGHPEKAKPLCEESRTLLEEASDLAGLAATWDSLGECHRMAGSFDDAIECFTTAAALAEDIQAFPLAAEVLTRLGECHDENRDPDGALRAWSRAAQALQREAIPDVVALAALDDRIREHTGSS